MVIDNLRVSEFRKYFIIRKEKGQSMIDWFELKTVLKF